MAAEDGNATTPTVATPVSTVTTTRRRTATGLYQHVLIGLTLIGAWSFCFGMWYAGAWFTLQWLASLGAPVTAWGIWAWAIPIIVTATELVFIRNRDMLTLSLLFLVLLFDVGSTIFGIYPWLTERTIAGWTPEGNLAWFIAAAAGGIMALAPEPLAHAITKRLKF